jgi:uncharacterized protein with HEPN domain
LKGKDRSKLYVTDLLESMDNVIEYLDGLTYAEFSNDKMRVDAVLRNIQIMGEAARNISDEIKEMYPEVPWRRIIGLRNIVVHAYFGVDLETIWKIGKENIPDTRPLIWKIMEEMEWRYFNSKKDPKI